MSPEHATSPLRHTLDQATRRLAANAVESPRLAAEFLLAHALDREPAELRHAVLVAPDQAVPAGARARFSGFVERHAQGEPVAYITGEWEFYGIPLFVGPAVLIPRPESEMLVRAVLAELAGAERVRTGLVGADLTGTEGTGTELTSAERKSTGNNGTEGNGAGLAGPDRPVRVADLGTGSGCLAIAVLKHCPGPIRLLAVDTSPEALAVAQRNRLRHHLEDRMALLRADFTRPFARPGAFDLILANPPYVSAEEYRALAHNVRAFEPHAALVPDCGPNRAPRGQTGFEHIAALAVQCAAALRPGGRLLMEIGDSQGPETMLIFREHGGWGALQVQPDLAGRDRLFSARKNTG